MQPLAARAYVNQELDAWAKCVRCMCWLFVVALLLQLMLLMPTITMVTTIIPTMPSMQRYRYGVNGHFDSARPWAKIDDFTGRPHATP
jgi:hypothetical protein